MFYAPGNGAICSPYPPTVTSSRRERRSDKKGEFLQEAYTHDPYIVSPETREPSRTAFADGGLGRTNAAPCSRRPLPRRAFSVRQCTFERGHDQPLGARD